MDYSASGLPEPSVTLAGEYVDEEGPTINLDFANEFHTRFNNLNDSQREIFNKVQEALLDETQRSKMFFVDGPGGSGKTYLFESMINYAKSINKSVLPGAYTGIAASLLPEGQTIHSRFGVPFVLERDTTWEHTGPKFEALKNCDLILWDEVSMAHKYMIEAVDRMMRDLCQINLPFGGKVVVFAGDFRQTLPIIVGADLSRAVYVCFKNSRDLWPLVEKFSLAQNMRAHEDPEFAEWLLKLGNGQLEGFNEHHSNYIQMPPRIMVPRDPNELVKFAFNAHDNVIDPAMINGNNNSAILTPLNKDVDKINHNCLGFMNTEHKEYLSADRLCMDEDDYVVETYQTETLNATTPNGYPLHRLELKLGCVVMLLKNISLFQGLCNGTRLKILQMRETYVEAQILFGPFAGKTYLICRHKFQPIATNPRPFDFERVQFPLKLAFAMTINKSQGQTFNRIAIYLPEPVFAHGQLYVAMSRVRRFEDVRVLIENRHVGPNRQGTIRPGDMYYYTRNVVCREVLTNE